LKVPLLRKMKIVAQKMLPGQVPCGADPSPAKCEAI